MTTPRAQPLTVVTMPTPVVTGGKPHVPAWAGTVSATWTALIGPSHIHAMPPPKPRPRPGGGYLDGQYGLAGPWLARWTVDSLPDPDSGSFYWLGDPSSADGTAGIASGARQWAPDGGVVGAPSWHSFFPYKPSVTAVNHYLLGGDVVTHPKGVNFNSHFIEHMWMDWGAPHPVPYTWVVAAMVTSQPSPDYVHYLLDAGRNPDDLGIARISADDCGTPRLTNEHLGYRNMLAITPSQVQARTNGDPALTLRAGIDAAVRPKMFFVVADGSTSIVGAISPGRSRMRRGLLPSTGGGSALQHRYYVMGRRYGILSQDHSGHLLVFELRYWNKALTPDQLTDQYDRIAPVYQFNRYRGL